MLRMQDFLWRSLFAGPILSSFGLCIWICGLFSSGSLPAFGVACKVAAAHAPSDAESAFLKGDFDQAVTLYQAQLKLKPDDPESIAGLVDALLRQRKVADAADLVQKALASQPKSTILLTAKAEVLYRQGTPWLAGNVVEDTIPKDPCNARLHFVHARLLRLSSYYAGEQRELRVAHQLDPYDPAIRREWINTLSTRQRIAELEQYLASPTGDDPEDISHLRTYLEALQKRLTDPHKSCRLVSSTNSTEIPFAMMMRDATHIRAFGLDVKLNDHNARLEIDTGAGGLLVSRSVAQRAGLKSFVETKVSGVGSEGEKKAYAAYADSIKIGSLEFHDCMVEVLDSRNVVDSDGLIGMDVLSGFLVTLDYPIRKLELGPLPPRPTDTGPQAPALHTGEGSEDDEDTPATGATAGTAGQPLAKDSAAKPAVVSATTPKGPQDRYIAPEMKSYNSVYRVGHLLMIPTSLNKASNPPKLFILDTGAFSTTISPEAAREVTKLHGNGTVAAVKGISGKEEKVYQADNVTFYFANLAQAGTNVVSFDTSNLSKSEGLEISGLIGANTLGQLTMHIDYRDGLVKFDYDPNR
jgi:tetratricopeptide (TPR) repeat protein